MRKLRYLFVVWALALAGLAQAEERLPDAPYANINYAQLVDLLNRGGLLIDIRRPEEWRQTGVIKGSRLITLFDRNGRVQRSFFDKLVQVAPHPDQPVAVICRTGHRSRAGSQILRELGYRRVYNVSNGITGWIRQGLRVERYPASPARQ